MRRQLDVVERRRAWRSRADGFPRRRGSCSRSASRCARRRRWWRRGPRSRPGAGPSRAPAELDVEVRVGEALRARLQQPRVGGVGRRGRVGGRKQVELRRLDDRRAARRRRAAPAPRPERPRPPLRRARRRSRAACAAPVPEGVERSAFSRARRPAGTASSSSERRAVRAARWRSRAARSSGDSARRASSASRLRPAMVPSASATRSRWSRSLSSPSGIRLGESFPSMAPSNREDARG